MIIFVILLGGIPSQGGRGTPKPTFSTLVQVWNAETEIILDEWQFVELDRKQNICVVPKYSKNRFHITVLYEFVVTI